MNLFKSKEALTIAQGFLKNFAERIFRFNILCAYFKHHPVFHVTLILLEQLCRQGGGQQNFYLNLQGAERQKKISTVRL